MLILEKSKSWINPDKMDIKRKNKNALFFLILGIWKLKEILSKYANIIPHITDIKVDEIVSNFIISNLRIITSTNNEEIPINI